MTGFRLIFFFAWGKVSRSLTSHHFNTRSAVNHSHAAKVKASKHVRTMSYAAGSCKQFTGIRSNTWFASNCGHVLVSATEKESKQRYQHMLEPAGSCSISTNCGCRPCMTRTPKGGPEPVKHIKIQASKLSQRFFCPFVCS